MDSYMTAYNRKNYFWKLMLVIVFGIFLYLIQNVTSFNTERTSSDSPSPPTTAFIIRSHRTYNVALMSLFYGLQFQKKYYGNVLCIVVPTEYDEIDPIKKYLKKFAKFESASRFEYKILDVPKATYDAHATTLQKICTPEWKSLQLRNGFNPNDLERVCTVNSPLHYQITDIALRKVLRECNDCKYVVVTNADNSYSPKFLAEAIEFIQNYDFIVTDMIHADAYYKAEVKKGHMDLGGVMFKTDYLAKSNMTFISALPSPAEAHHYHDADFLLVDKLVTMGGRVGILNKVLFNHN